MVQQPVRVNQPKGTDCPPWGADKVQPLQHHCARHVWRMRCLIGKYTPGAVRHSYMSMHCPLSASCDGLSAFVAECWVVRSAAVDELG